MIALALIWLAALVLAMGALGQSLGARRTRLWPLVAAVLVVVALTSQVLA